MSAVPKLKNDPVSEFKAACAVACAEIYADIDLKVSVTRLCLSNVAVAVRYRQDLFGDDVMAVGDYISTALSGSDMLMHNAEELLQFAGYFDHSPERAEKAEECSAAVQACCADLSLHLGHVISIADTDAVPDFFLRMEPVAEPKTLLSKRMAGLATVMTNMLASHDLRMQMLDNLALGAREIAKTTSRYADIFKKEAGNILAVQEQCAVRRIEIKTLAERLQPNPFA